MVGFSAKPNRRQNLAFSFTLDHTHLELGGQLNSQPNYRVPRIGPAQDVLWDGSGV